MTDNEHDEMKASTKLKLTAAGSAAGAVAHAWAYAALAYLKLDPFALVAGLIGAAMAAGAIVALVGAADACDRENRR